MRALACPNAFGAHDVVTDPQAGAGSCDCPCSINTQPVCDLGTMSTYYSSGNSCGNQGTTLNVNGPGCNGLNGNIDNYFKGVPPALSGGTCTGTATSHPSQVTTAPVRVCDSSAACKEDVCNGYAPQGFAACIYKQGAATCPAPWSTPFDVGDSPSLGCSACTSCNVSGTCASGKLSLYTSGNCNNNALLVTLAVDNTCVPTNNGGSGIGSWKYAATLNAQCQASGTTPTVGLNAERTVCCR